MICLSKNLDDEYINMFARGANLPTQDYDTDFGSNPILIRSMGKRKLIHQCWETNHPFYFMDSGYVGNYKSPSNPYGWKQWHRKTIFEDLDNCHALVTYQSIAAVESVLYGVPAFTLAPTAADPVSDKDLSLIETPSVHDIDKVYKWACHLAYGQFHLDELKNGTAYRILMNENC